MSVRNIGEFQQNCTVSHCRRKFFSCFPALRLTVSKYDKEMKAEIKETECKSRAKKCKKASLPAERAGAERPRLVL
jgi:hypothetical protein